MMISFIAVLAAATYTLTPPNIIMLMADDQGWGDVGYNHHEYRSNSQPRWVPNAPRTPNLDAMARSNGSIVFWRWYAGSAVCSPSRAAAMTGRTNDRECITGPEPHGYGPAWECFAPLPLSPRVFTIAEAAKAANYTTFHSGKWHLGDFFPKRKHGEPVTFANTKWPVSNPSTHGFDEWASTEASGPTSTPNCGCDPEWLAEGQGCVSGGGVWRKDRSWICMDYWQPSNNSDSKVCRSVNATRGCVANSTAKIVGDDAAHIVDSFEAFLDRRDSKAAMAATALGAGDGAGDRNEAASPPPFLAVLWLHTIHMPRGALPQFYHAYNDSFGDWAGDYLGALTQMDVQVGRLRQLLRDRGLANNTLLWYTSDNGPNAQLQRTQQVLVTAPRDRSTHPQYAATCGLRQCKASLYEGGIRVPGILEWPAMIKRNAATHHPAYHADYLPTFLDVTGTSHPQPTWAADGISLLPLIHALGTSGAVNDTSRRPSTHPLVFQLHGQSALIDNEWKVLDSASAGDCDQEPGSLLSGRLLFNLEADPTESTDLSRTLAERFHNMSAALDAFKRSVVRSATTESRCSKAFSLTHSRSSDSPESDSEDREGEARVGVGRIMPACKSPLAPHPRPPAPAPPVGPAFALHTVGFCLAAEHPTERSLVAMAACTNASGAPQQRQRWRVGADATLVLNGTSLCPKPKGGRCVAGAQIWLGQMNCNLYGFMPPSRQGTIALAHGCDGDRKEPLCLLYGKDTGLLRVGACTDPEATGWSEIV